MSLLSIGAAALNGFNVQMIEVIASALDAFEADPAIERFFVESDSWAWGLVTDIQFFRLATTANNSSESGGKGRRKS